MVLDETSWWAWAVLACLGAVMGSFYNVVIHRFPRILHQRWHHEARVFLGQAPHTPTTLSFSSPRSHCPHCAQSLRWWCNVPLVSFVVLRGSCLDCKAPIAWRYPLVELFGLVAALASVGLMGWSLEALFVYVLLSYLVVLTCIDWATQLLPDELTLSLLWWGLVLSTLAPGPFCTPSEAIWGAVLGYGVLWLSYLLFKGVTGKEGMGFGDFKLLSALGAWFGAQALAVILFSAALMGSVVGLAAIFLAGHSRHAPIPFGPFLALSACMVLVLGVETSNAWLLGWFS